MYVELDKHGENCAWPFSVRDEITLSLSPAQFDHRVDSNFLCKSDRVYYSTMCRSGICYMTIIFADNREDPHYRGGTPPVTNLISRTGFRNTGNSCFINASLQVLKYIYLFQTLPIVILYLMVRGTVIHKIYWDTFGDLCIHTQFFFPGIAPFKGITIMASKGIWHY